jgi:hypothetical protein
MGLFRCLTADLRDLRDFDEAAQGVGGPRITAFGGKLSLVGGKEAVIGGLTALGVAARQLRVTEGREGNEDGSQRRRSLAADLRRLTQTFPIPRLGFQRAGGPGRVRGTTVFHSLRGDRTSPSHNFLSSCSPRTVHHCPKLFCCAATEGSSIIN